MTSAFPKILQLGDKALSDLYDEEVEITEKLDGSQFGFGLIDGELKCRSKGRELDLFEVDMLFKPAVQHVLEIKELLPNNVFFYGETLAKPRHSTLKYENTPKNHIALFGAIDTSNRALRHDELVDTAGCIDVDVTPLLYYGKSSIDHTKLLLNADSYLGGQKVEGVVVKRYVDWLFLGQFIVPVKAGKLVSEQFKEVHRRDWPRMNRPNQLEELKISFRTEPRWAKAVLYLRDNGQLEGSVRDIGSLYKRVQTDIIEEEQENLKDELWKIFSKEILKSSTAGLAEWYKEKLLEDAGTTT